MKVIPFRDLYHTEFVITEPLAKGQNWYSRDNNYSCIGKPKPSHTLLWFKNCRAVITDKSGKALTVEKNQVAYMAKTIEYTVNFISAGKIISSRVYRYGEKPVIPPEPFRTSDNEYSYKFLTWSAPVVEVTKDVDYEALYLKEKLPEKEKGDGLQISDSVFKLIVEVAFAAGFAILVFIPCAIIVIVKVVNRVCRKPAPKKKKKP